MDVVISYMIKALGDLFLVVGIGFPTALLVIGDSRYYFLRLTLAASILSGLFIYLVFMITTNVATLTLAEFRIIFALVFVVPFVFPKTRSNLSALFKKFSLPKRLGFLETFTLSLVIILLISTFLIALQSTPILDDPLAVWLFLGKKIYLMGKIPVFFGNAADISESGNYPPMAPFMASSVFFLFHSLNPSNYTMIPWYYGALGIAAIVYLVKELGGSTESALAGALIALVTTIYSLEMFGWGYTDTIDAFYVIAFLAFVLSTNRSIFGSTIFALFAFTDAIESKYDVLLVLVPSILLLLYVKRDFFKLERKYRVFGLGLFAFVLVVMASWFVRNWEAVHDPIYPFLAGIFHAKGIVPSIKSLVPPSSFPIPPFSPLFLLYDRTYSGLTNEGNLWPSLIWGFGGILFILFIRREKLLTSLSLWVLSSFAIVLAFWELNGGYERYLIIVVPGLATLSGLFFDMMIKKLHGDGVGSKSLFAQFSISYASSKPVHLSLDRVRLVKLMRYVVVVSILILSFTSMTALLTAQPATSNSTYLQSWNFVNSLPVGLVATNDIREFYANQQVVQLYNIPALFNSTTLQQSFGALKAANITYIYFDSRFDYNVYANHTFLIQILSNSTYVTTLGSFQLGVNDRVIVYKVN